MCNLLILITLKDIQVINIVKIKYMNSKPSCTNNKCQNKRKSQEYYTTIYLFKHTLIPSRGRKTEKKSEQKSKKSARQKNSKQNSIRPPNLEVMAFQDLPGLTLRSPGKIGNKKPHETLNKLKQVIAFAELLLRDKLLEVVDQNVCFFRQKHFFFELFYYFLHGELVDLGVGV